MRARKYNSKFKLKYPRLRIYKCKNFFLKKNAILFKNFSEHLIFLDQRSSILQIIENIEVSKHTSTFFRKILKLEIIHVFKIFNSMLNNYRFTFFTKPLLLSEFFSANNSFPNDDSDEKLLTFNFKRNRFFPDLQTKSGNVYFNLSLGLFAFFYKKGKFFIKNKQVFLVVASFLRKMLLFCSLGNLIFVVKRTPIYLQELLTTLNNPVINLYKHPFHDETVDESFLKNKFNFKLFLFLTNRPYGFVKVRKKGRVKRKITKRIVSINRLID